MSDFERISEEVFESTESGVALKEKTIQRMKERMKQIDQAIEVHLETLKYETGPSYDESIDISQLSTKEKLQILILNHEYIDQSSQRGQTLRIRGVTQSYYMFDANQYKDHQLMLSVIAQELDSHKQDQTKTDKVQSATGLNFHPAESELMVQPAGASHIDVDQEENQGNEK